MRITVLYNPGAGDEGLDRKELKSLLKNAGYSPTMRSVKKKGWKAALDDPGAFVVAAGGDGTVAKVARKLAGRGVPLAVLPAGTANNIARSLGIDGDPRQLMERWPTAHPIPIDIGIIDGPMGEKRFVEAVGVGVVPDLMDESEKRIPKDDTPADEQLSLNVDLMIELLEDAEPVECELIADDRDLSGAYLIVEIMNIRSIGPQVALAREADPGDGLLDIVAITAKDRAATINALGRRHKEGVRSLDVPRIRASRVRIAWDAGAIHVDDKRWPKHDRKPDKGRSATIEVVPGAVEVLL